MTLLMTGNEFGNVDCKGPRGYRRGVGQRVTWAGHCGGGRSSGRQRHEECVCCGHTDIYTSVVGAVRHGSVLGGGEEVGVGLGGVRDSRRAAVASSFAFVLCFNGRSVGLLAGASGSQVVTVLVLGPKPQPLLVLLLWFFGSLLP